MPLLRHFRIPPPPGCPRRSPSSCKRAGNPHRQDHHMACGPSSRPDSRAGPDLSPPDPSRTPNSIQCPRRRTTHRLSRPCSGPPRRKWNRAPGFQRACEIRPCRRQGTGQETRPSARLAPKVLHTIDGGKSYLESAIRVGGAEKSGVHRAVPFPVPYRMGNELLGQFLENVRRNPWPR